MNHVKTFYEQLYSEDTNIDHENNNFFNNSDRQLNDNEKISCEGRINEHECAAALKDMKNMKSPGSDGITAEFYKLYWE